MNITHVFAFSILSLITVNTSAQCLKAGIIDVAPYGYRTEEGGIKGIHWEFFDAIAKESGLCIKKHLLPYKRDWQNLSSGNTDISILSATPERHQFIQSIGFIDYLEIVVIPKKEMRIEQYKDLYPLRIGKMRGAKLNKKFDQDENLNITLLNNYQQAHSMLSNQRLDAVAGSMIGVQYYIENLSHHVHMNVTGYFLLEKRERWLHISDKSPYLSHMPTLKKSLAELERKAVYQSIKSSYLNKNGT